jgi:hypothetical protein
MKCPKCDRPMELEEKDTSSGRDMRTYHCRACDERVDVDNGIALWKIYLTRERRSKPRGSITRWRSDFLERRDTADGRSFGETDGEYHCELPDPSCHALADACG